MDDHAVLHTAAFCKLFTQGVALRVGKVLSPQQGVTEGQPSGNAVFPQQRQHLARSCPTAGNASPAPDAARRSAVDRADGAPVVKIFPVLPVQRQKAAVQLVKLEQAGQMIIGSCGLFHRGSFPSNGHFCGFQMPLSIATLLVKIRLERPTGRDKREI